MKRSQLFAYLTSFAFILIVALVSHVYSADGKVVVKSPAEGEIVNGSTVMVEMEIDKGKNGDHVHFYLDGKNLGVVRANKYELTDLAKGNHRIEARLASKGHAEIGPNGTAEFTVK